MRQSKSTDPRVTTAVVHISDWAPLVGVRVVALNTFPHQRPVMAAHAVEEAVKDPDTGPAPTGGHL